VINGAIYEVDSATRWGRHLAAAADSILEKFGSGPRRSLRRSAERPARAAWAALRLLADVAIGATMELGRSALVANAADDLMMGAAAGRALRGTGSSPTGGIERPAV
jgi:hypothetical protein